MSVSSSDVARGTAPASEKGESSPLPDYESPPVHEVVIGLTFEPLQAFRITHFGLLGERFKPAFPKIEHAPPVGIEHAIAEGKLTGWPLPRVWYINETEDRLVQVQTDRFYVNWRARAGGESYPRYQVMLARFEEQYSTFCQFLQDEGAGEIVPVLYELKYVNQIPRGAAWSTAEDVSRLFPDFSWRTDANRFLSHPDGGNWSALFNMPNESGSLTVRIAPSPTGQVKEDQRFITMELTASGPRSAAAPRGAWFDAAREWIVRGFADLTSPEVQRRVWGRKDGRT